MTADKPYGYVIEYERAKPNSGIMPQIETATMRRAGSEAAAKRAATLQGRFVRIVSCTPIPMSEAPAPRRKRRSDEPTDESPVRAQQSPGAISASQADAVAAAIRKALAAAEGLAAVARDRRTLIQTIRENVTTIDSLFPSPDGKTGRILERCDRLCELFNMEELESWQITLNNVLHATWERLP